MAVSVLETIKSRANAANTAYIAVLSLLCDTYIDLPTQYGLTGYELAQGCKAHVIDTNTDYMLDSAGTWHIYGGEIWQNVYTKTETDALLDDKQDELTTAQLAAVNSGITAAKLTADEAALAELVDNGAKNRLKLQFPFTTTVNGVTFTVQSDQTVFVTGTATDTAIATISTEPYVARQGDILVSGLSAANAYAYVYTRGGTTSTSRSPAREFLPSDIGEPRSIAIAILPEAGSVSMTFKPIICTAQDWAISQKFVPYCPSMAEMYQMILALQSN